jgi:hypothetical protein
MHFLVMLPTLVSAHSEVTLETADIFVYTHIFFYFICSLFSACPITIGNTTCFA